VCVCVCVRAYVCVCIIRAHSLPVGCYLINGVFVPSVDIQTTLMQSIYQVCAHVGCVLYRRFLRSHPSAVFILV
jgi:hypothetical protein